MSKLPYDLDEHIDHIDAALFTGDTFTTRENIDTLTGFLRRWHSQIQINMKMVLEQEYFESCQDDCPNGCDDCRYLNTMRDPFGTGDSPTEYECTNNDFNECPQVKDDE